MPDITSRPYRPNPEMCCPACAWGHFNTVGGLEVEVNEHSGWCPVGKKIEAEIRAAIDPSIWGKAELHPMEFYEPKRGPEGHPCCEVHGK